MYVVLVLLYYCTSLLGYLFFSFFFSFSFLFSFLVSSLLCFLYIRR